LRGRGPDEFTTESTETIVCGVPCDAPFNDDQKGSETVKSNSASLFVVRVAAVAGLGLWLFAAVGCGSGARSNSVERAPGSNNAAGHIDVMCIGEQIEKPVEAFHYSYKYSDPSNWLNDEADITPQVMDITMKDKSGSRAYHGVRADEASWNSAVLNLSSLSITVMASRLASLDGGSAIVGQGPESMNGYEATKYSIDTTSARPSDQKTFQTLFGPGSYEKGTVWMGPDGCAVKLVLDEGIWQMNGPIEKKHFEMARSKK
jgi:hypothetical protein